MDNGVEVRGTKPGNRHATSEAERRMGSFGERMRRERDKRGITLDSISQTTKIGTHILEALEKEEFDKLPGGIFNKGFVRSYANFLGMNEEQVLKEFIEVAGDPEQPLPDPPLPRLAARFGEAKLAGGEELTSVAWGLAARARQLFSGA